MRLDRVAQVGQAYLMNAAEARRVTEESCRLTSATEDYFRNGITRAARHGFSSVSGPYEPQSGLWDTKAFKSLVADGYQVRVYPVEQGSDQLFEGRKTPGQYVISW